jgi:hypothetical protein
MAAATEPCRAEILSIAICQDPTDRLPGQVDVEADRRLRMIRILRPAGDAFIAYQIDESMQPLGTRRLVGALYRDADFRQG